MEYFHINYEFDRHKVQERIDDRIASGNPGYICVADGNILTRVHKDLGYRKVVHGALFSICDSSWVPLFLKKIYGMKVGQYCGSDIFRDFINAKKYNMYFLGANKDILDALRDEQSKVDPRIADMVFEELPYCKVDEFDYQSIAAKINSVAPEIIWLALGAPKQEVFASKLVPYLTCGTVVIPVGAVFNFFSGLNIKRAPDWMIMCHLEFLYRIFSEPKKQINRCWNIVTTLPGVIREEKRSDRSLQHA